MEFDTLFFSMMYFFETSGHFFFASSVYDIYILSAHTLSAASRVHGYVAAADDSYVLVFNHGSIIFGEFIRLHEVYTCQILVCGIHAVQILTGDMHEHRETCARAYEYSFIALFEQLVESIYFTDNHVVLNFYAHLAQTFYLCVNQLFGQTELRYSILKNAACYMKRLENRYIIACLSEVGGAGKTCGAGAYYSNLFALLRNLRYVLIAFLHSIVSTEALQTADTYGHSLLAADAFTFALRLLRAHAAAYRGQTVCLFNFIVCFDELAFLNQTDEIRYLYVYRAS